MGEEIKFFVLVKLEGCGVEMEGIYFVVDYICEEFKCVGFKSGVLDGSYY